MALPDIPKVKVLLSRADLNYEAGMAKNIHYGDVLIKFGEVLDTRKET